MSYLYLLSAVSIDTAYCSLSNMVCLELFLSLFHRLQMSSNTNRNLTNGLITAIPSFNHDTIFPSGMLQQKSMKFGKQFHLFLPTPSNANLADASDSGSRVSSKGSFNEDVFLFRALAYEKKDRVSVTRTSSVFVNQYINDHLYWIEKLSFK